MNPAVRMETKIRPRPIPCTHCRDQPLGLIYASRRARVRPVPGSDNEAMKAAAAKATQEKEAAEAKVVKAKESRAQIIAEAKAGSQHRLPPSNSLYRACSAAVSSWMRCTAAAQLLPVPHTGKAWQAVDVEWTSNGGVVADMTRRVHAAREEARKQAAARERERQAQAAAAKAAAAEKAAEQEAERVKAAADEAEVSSSAPPPLRPSDPPTLRRGPGRTDGRTG
jgi:hypothetical protein